MNDQNGKELKRCEQELTALLEPEEVADLLRLSTKDVHGLVRAGELACVQISPRKRLFTIRQIQAYVQSKTIQRRVDTKTHRPVSSRPKKGGDTNHIEGTKTEVSRASLIQEMSQWD